MNIDLSPDELTLIVQLAETGNMADPVVASIHAKALRCLQSFKPRADFDDDPKTAAEKWKAPL